jgi:hypothetical protein
LATAMTDEIAQLIDNYRNLRKDIEDDDGQVQNYLKTYYYVFEFNSPYAEVRASVSNTDDPALPVETFRAWFIGMFFGSLFGAANQVSKVPTLF